MLRRVLRIGRFDGEIALEPGQATSGPRLVERFADRVEGRAYELGSIERLRGGIPCATGTESALMTLRNPARAGECHRAVQDVQVKTTNVILDERGWLMALLRAAGGLSAHTSG